MAKTPDFIIAGSAKCGTTTLWRWLSSHTDVFMPSVKEPSFFAFEGCNPRPRSGRFDPDYVNRITTEWSEYTALFEPSRERCLGEASPVYMSAAAAPGRIAARLPRVRVIIILRNPVERAFSQFMHHVRDGLEPEHDFGRALDLEHRRLSDGWWWGFGYRTSGYYFAQISRFLNCFPREQLLILTSEELATAPEPTYQRICGFLEISSAHAPDLTERANKASFLPMVPRSGFLQQLIRHPGSIATVSKAMLPQPFRRRLRGCIDRMNSRPSPKLAPKTSARLAADYSSDVTRLEALLGRRFDAWRNPKSGGTAIPNWAAA